MILGGILNFTMVFRANAKFSNIPIMDRANYTLLEAKKKILNINMGMYNNISRDEVNSISQKFDFI